MGSLEVTLLADTHVLLWWLADGQGLSRAQIEALERSDRAGDRVGIAAITLWEIAMLTARNRIRLTQSVDGFLDALEANPRLAVLPLSARAALESTRLGSDFHRDPADQLIVATARLHGLRVVTADRRIRNSNLVSVV